MSRLVRRLLLVAGIGSVLIPAAPAIPVTPEIPVLTGPAGEFQPARTTNAIAWEQNTRARPNEYDVMVQIDGSAPIQANTPPTSAAMGDLSEDRLIYQQYRGNPRTRGRSDLFVFETTSNARYRLPDVNSRRWEYWPSVSGDWLLFGRWDPSSGVRRLFLHNMVSGERRVLDKTTGRKVFLGPGQVSGNYAVWYVCRARCEVFRYDIANRHETVVSNPGSSQRAPSVTLEGTVYFSRGGRRCGASVTLVRDSLTGPQQVMVQLQRGIDIADTYAFARPDGSTEVYYERNVCNREAGSDVYMIRESSLATLTVHLAGQGTVLSAPGGINCGSDCVEDYEVGATVTLGAHPGPGQTFAGWSGACTGTTPCTVTMDSSKEVTATFVPAGSITVRKETSPANEGAFLFETTPDISGGPFSLADDGSRAFSGLVRGSYSVTELDMPDWQLQSITCAGGGSNTSTFQSGPTATVGLDAGESVLCTFFNRRD